ncbi:MAG: DUF4760 domain-containing protein [Nitrosopumilaceae archaeon]
MKNTDIDTLLKMYEIYDRHRSSLLWFLQELDTPSYDEYQMKYAGKPEERVHFTSVCGFFELCGVLVNSRLIDKNLYFDLFNPTPFWIKAKPIVYGMRKDRPHIYENFELLNKKRLIWAKKRKGKKFG